MSNNESNDQGNHKSNGQSNHKSNGQSNNRSAIMLAAIGVLTIALLLLPPFPPWLRVVAVMFVVLAVLGELGIFPRLRATWRRSLRDLPSDDQRNARWKRVLGLIGVLILALLLLPPLPPRFRIIAVVLAVFAILGVLGMLPGLRTTSRRWLSGLVIMFGVILVLLAFGPFPPPGFWRGGDDPVGVLRPSWVWSRPILSWVPAWLTPTTTGTARHFTLLPPTFAAAPPPAPNVAQPPSPPPAAGSAAPTPSRGCHSTICRMQPAYAEK
jgi:hypothetical protein